MIFPRDPNVIKDEIMHHKRVFDQKHMRSIHPAAKEQKLHEWELLQERIKPLVDELRLVSEWYIQIEERQARRLLALSK